MRGITAASTLGMPCVYVPTNQPHETDQLGPKVKQLRSLADLTPDLVESILREWEPGADHTLPNLLSGQHRTT